MRYDTRMNAAGQGCPESMEFAALQRLDDAIETIKNDLSWYWHWGDGQGGWLLEKLADAVRANGLTWPFDAIAVTHIYKKQKINRTLSRKVMERDAYRCVSCGTHMDLSCDHIIPESKGGATTMENLQTMCRRCNSRKGVK